MYGEANQPSEGGGQTTYKLLIVPLMLVIWLLLYVNGIDQELAMKSYYKAKQAVNRGAHAAALQLDTAALADGFMQIDPVAARAYAQQYIDRNLMRNEQGRLADRSRLQGQAAIVYFEVLDSSLTYPYRYELSSYGFSTVFDRPAVVIVLHFTYQHVFSINNPVEWNIVGSAQLVPL